MRKIAMSVAASMPPITVVPMIRRATRAGTGRAPERDTAEDERERGHDDRAQTETRAFERGFEQRRAAFVGELRELDDQDGVLRRETDQHDEADLRIDIVFHPARPERGERAEDRDRRA